MFLCGSRHFWRQGSLWLAPFEGTKQRVQAGLFPSIRSAFTETFRDKGIAGLYAGYKAQVVRDIAFHMVQLPLYEAVRDAWVVGVQPLVGSRERHNAHAPMLSSTDSTSTALQIRNATWKNSSRVVTAFRPISSITPHTATLH